MNVLVWLVVGGVLGWLASIVMKTDGQQGIILNVVVGIVGSLIASFIIAPMLTGTINTNDFTIAGLMVSSSAPWCCSPVNLVRRARSASCRTTDPPMPKTPPRRRS